jgi:hypothetical protein
MFPILKGSTQKVYVRLVSRIDHITGKTGVTSPTLTLSKNGGSLATPSDGTWAELAGGLYTVQLNSTDTDTVGPLVLRVVKTGCDDFFVQAHVREATEATGPMDVSAGIESSVTLRQAIRLMLAVLAGKTSIAGAVATFRNVGDTKDRVTATMTGSQRTSVTVDGT